MITTYIDYYSLHPSKLVHTVRRETLVRNQDGFFEKYKYKSNTPASDFVNSRAPKKCLEKKFHNFKISANSARNLRSKVDYLFLFANKRNVKTYRKKTITNFKCTFLTLTLPAPQKTATAVLQREVFEPFLQSLRQRLDMRNYVWRLEFQKNGNAHYHLITDTYIDYFFAKRRWNECLEYHGYISDYSNSMSSMSWSEYEYRYKSNYTGSKEQLFRRYSDGKKENWRNPNSVDVKVLSSKNNIGGYIAKYFSKGSEKVNCNKLDNKENAFALRLAFWSRSLSRCKSESMPIEYYPADYNNLLKAVSTAVHKAYDYCRISYFNFSELPRVVQKMLWEYFGRVKSEISYISAT